MKVGEWDRSHKFGEKAEITSDYITSRVVPARLDPDGLAILEWFPRGDRAKFQKTRDAIAKRRRDTAWPNEGDTIPALDAIARDMGYEYRPEVADKVLAFGETWLTFTRGRRFAGAPLTWHPHQEYTILRPLFGWVHRDTGMRRFLRAWIEWGKKNGKTQLMAFLQTYMFLGEDEPGVEVYNAAVDQKQASICHGEVMRMLKASESLMEFCRVNNTTKTIHCDRLQGKCEALSKQSASKEGLDAYCIVMDEMHAWQSGELYNVLSRATIAREQTLMCQITTAGIIDDASIGWQQHQNAVQLLDGNSEDWRWLVQVCTAPDGCALDDAEAHRAANPLYGVTVRRDEIMEDAKASKGKPREELNFRRYRLNQWVHRIDTWLNMELWDSCCDEKAEPDPSWPCYAGIDLADRRDLTAMAIVWLSPDGDYFPRFWFWCPTETAKARTTDPSYLLWKKQGLLRLTPGDAISFSEIEQDIAELVKKHSVREVAFDPWSARQMAQRLDEIHQVEMIEFRQSPYAMHEPSQLLETCLDRGSLVHDGNPIARWNAKNAAIYEDTAGHYMPSKARSGDKIDGVVALVMALGRAMLHAKTNPYAERGILVI